MFVLVILNNFCQDLFENIASEASKLVAMTKKSTLDARAIQTAARLVLPGELSNHAVSEGTKAVRDCSQLYVTACAGHKIQQLEMSVDTQSHTTRRFFSAINLTLNLICHERTSTK